MTRAARAAATVTTPAVDETPLNLGGGLRLPLEAVTETFAILAKRGAGETTAAGVLVEELVAAQQQAIVIDPVGVWWGLRSHADGVRRGLCEKDGGLNRSTHHFVKRCLHGYVVAVSEGSTPPAFDCAAAVASLRRLREQLVAMTAIGSRSCPVWRTDPGLATRTGYWDGTEASPPLTCGVPDSRSADGTGHPAADRQ